jgi:hypothetical protein
MSTVREQNVVNNYVSPCDDLLLFLHAHLYMALKLKFVVSHGGEFEVLLIEEYMVSWASDRVLFRTM